MRTDQNISEAVLELFQDTLDRPIAFHPVFVDLTGSVTAGLLLSQAVYWTKRTTADGWFYKTIQQWEEETRLSRHEQETARKILRRFSFWHEERRGVPARMYFMVDIAALYSELLSIAESRKLDCCKPANKIAGKRQTGMPQSGKHYKGISETTTEITSETTTTTPLSPLQTVPGTPSNPGSGREVIEKMLTGSMLENADPGRIAQVAQKYNRSREEIETAIDVLDLQYCLSGRMINDPTALLVTALKDGVLVPENYVPRSTLEVEEAETEAEEDREAKESEEAEYKTAAEKLEDLPEEEREEIYAQAGERVPAILRNSRRALRSFAIEMLVERARAPS